MSGASFRAIKFGAGAEFTRRDAHGRKWFWVLLPKQNDLVGGGETPHNKILKEKLAWWLVRKDREKYSVKREASRFTDYNYLGWYF